MGFFDKVVTNSMSWGYNAGLKGIEEQIKRGVKEKRLILRENDAIHVRKDKRQTTYTYDQIAGALIEAGGWRKNMEALGISEEDVKNIILKYKKEGI